MSESTVQRAIRLHLGQLRLPFLRYQCGTFLTMQGNPIHLGDKGVSDLIGITPHTVTQEDVGRTIGVFTALEIKKPKGSRTADHQGTYLRLINRLGGLGAIVKSPEDAEAVTRDKWKSKLVIDYSSKDE